MPELPPNLVVATDSPFRTLKLAIAFCLLMVLSFIAGRWDGIDSLVQSQDALELLNQRLAKAERDVSEHKKVSAQRQSELVLHSETEHLLKNHNKSLQNQVYLLNKDLKLYQNIMSPGKAQNGIKVAKMEIVPTSVAERYRILLTLIQESSQHRLTRGEVSGRVSGRTKDGKASEIEFSKLGGSASLFRYQFRYFQVLDEELMLPAGFVPDRVTFELPVSTGSQKMTPQSFNWVVKEAMYYVEEQQQREDGMSQDRHTDKPQNSS